MFALETKNLTKHFDGVHALDHLSFGIEQGKITGIIGPNGSGKTTLINLLSGILPMDGGVVVIGTQKLSRLAVCDVALYGITRTFQDVRVFEQMTVLDNILVVVTERNVFRSLFEKRSDYHLKKSEEVLSRVCLWGKRHQLASKLSYGQRKLLEIARALAMNVEIYLLDEPFAGLFPEMVEVVCEIARELKRQGKTVVLIEHNMNVIRKLCDHTVVMDGGTILAEGGPEEVLENKEVIEAYLGA